MQRLLVLVEDLRADRHLQHDVGAVGAGAVLAHAVAAGLGLEVLLVAIIDQRVEPVDAFDDDVAAAPAVAAVRPAEFDELLAPKRDAAGAAVAGADIDLGLVEEFHLPLTVRKIAAGARRTAYALRRALIRKARLPFRRRARAPAACRGRCVRKPSFSCTCNDERLSGRAAETIRSSEVMPKARSMRALAASVV